MTPRRSDSTRTTLERTSNRAFAWQSKENLDKAIADYTEAIRLDPKYVRAYLNRACGMGIEAGLRQGHRRLRRGDPARPRACPGVLQPGRCLVRKGRFRQGHRRLRRGRSGSIPTTPAAYKVRGTAWERKREYDKAIADCNEVIRLDPGSAVAYQNRGLVLDDRRAISTGPSPTSTEAIRLDPRDAEAYLARGCSWNLKGELDQAIADLDRAIRLDPTNAEALLLPGQCRAREGRFRPGHRRFHRGDPTRSQGRPACTRAGAEPGKRKGDYDKALADFNEAIRLDPDDPASHNGRAWIWATCPDAQVPRRHRRRRVGESRL